MTGALIDGLTFQSRAAIWNGSGGPVSLHPAGADASVANDVNRGAIVIGNVLFLGDSFDFVANAAGDSRLLNDITAGLDGRAIVDATSVNDAGEIAIIAENAAGQRAPMILRSRP